MLLKRLYFKDLYISIYYAHTVNKKITYYIIVKRGDGHNFGENKSILL